MSQYYKFQDDTYHCLAVIDELAFLISSKGTKGPVAVSVSELDTMQRVFVPPYDLSGLTEYQKQEMSHRYHVITDILSDEAVVDSDLRETKIREAASSNSLNIRTVRCWVYRYWYSGKAGLVPEVRRKEKKYYYELEIKEALRRYYYSSRAMTAVETYHQMLSEFFCDEDGVLFDERPTWYQFEKYLKDHKSALKASISQKGISDYKKNHRPLYGANRGPDEGIGCYQLDATVLDCYVVSKYNRHETIGRPSLYVAVDSYSSLICGIYLGFDKTRNAVFECLRFASMSEEDRAELFLRYGVKLKKGEWPCSGLPRKIVTDRGQEFLSEDVLKIVCDYGIEITNLPAYRPDLKGQVEQSIHLTMKEFKPSLRGYGVVEKDEGGIGVHNYVEDACLTLDKMMSVVLISCIRLNAYRALENFLRPQLMAEQNVPVIPAKIWQYSQERGQNKTIPMDEKNQLFLLSKGEARFTRKGLLFQHLYYYHPAYNSRCAEAGLSKVKDDVTVAYTSSDTSYVYLIEDGEYTKFVLTPSSDRFKESAFADVDSYLQAESRARNELKEYVSQGKVNAIRQIKGIRNRAKEEKDNEGCL